MRPVYADPKTDFAFKRIFATKKQIPLLILFLNDLLDRTGKRAITKLEHLSVEQRPRVDELKLSLVDVKCQDASGTIFVVEMQVLNVEGFEKRVVFNASKAYVNQLDAGAEYEQLHNVIAISICDFQLWPDEEGKSKVPLLSRWRMREKSAGREGLSQVQYVFVELPKLPMKVKPRSVVEQWAYLFRHAATLKGPPAELKAEGPRRALEVAKTATFTEAEWDAYDAANIASVAAKGAIKFALRSGEEKGRVVGREEGRVVGREEGRVVGREEGREEGARTLLLELMEQKVARAFTQAERQRAQHWLLALSPGLRLKRVGALNAIAVRAIVGKRATGAKIAKRVKH